MQGTNCTRRSLLVACVAFTFEKRVGTVLNQELFTKYLPVYKRWSGYRVNRGE
jgi:hypothetical protein